MHCDGWQVQNLQGELAGWQSREEVLTLLFKSKVTLLADSLHQGGWSYLLRASPYWIRPTSSNYYTA